MRIFFRKLHRWLGLLMVLQISAWMISGLYFSIFPISEIRGEHLTHPAEAPDRHQLDSAASPADALAAVDAHLGVDWTLSRAELLTQDGVLYWRVSGEIGGESFARLVESISGEVRPALDAARAAARARALLSVPASEPRLEWIEQAPDNLEFRGRPLPAWRAGFDQPEGLQLYLDPWTGEVLARRTDRWRVFDFLWMLHIMDFDTRDDFNHPLLQISAALGVIVVVGGFALWAVTTPLFRRRRRTAAG